jgi:tripartite-type tricarboxylate transporter receptor subunit TctC
MAGLRQWCRIVAALNAVVVAALSCMAAQAQTWPSRPVKVIMATAAGSAPDVIARIVTDRLSQLWGQQILILNRPGAGGLIALQALAASERDGHTLYMPSSSSLVVLPVTNANLPLNIERDLVPIGLVGEQPFAIIASNSLGVSTLPEFIALAKRKPGEITYAANFRGSLPNMTGEWFRDRAGIEMTFVPYPGAPQGIQDVMGGRISAMVEGLAVFVGPMASNSIRPLGITSPKRLPNYPDLPAVTETVPGFDSRGWFAVLAFTGTPEEVVRKVNADLRTVLDIPEVRQRFETLATYVRHLTPAETGKFIRDEQEAWRPVVKKVGVTSP